MKKDAPDGMHDAWFFIGVFIFIFLIWAATGGPIHPISFGGPTLAQPDVLGGGTYLSLPRAAFGVGSSNVVLPGSSGGGNSFYGSSGSSYDGSSGGSSAGITFAPPSPFRGAVSMNNYVSNASSSDPRTEYVQISVAQNAQPVNITGWVLESASSRNREVIPRGTRVPTSGSVNQANDIVLAPGETAYIISGRSPLGVSFRENICTGYLSTFQSFTPSLPQNCPAPVDEVRTFYANAFTSDPDCMEYVENLPRCEAVPFPDNDLTRACRDFVKQHLTYNSCVTTHRADPDFNGRVWHIYLGRDKHMWRARYEVVLLLDAGGRTVASFSY